MKLVVTCGAVAAWLTAGCGDLEPVSAISTTDQAPDPGTAPLPVWQTEQEKRSVPATLELVAPTNPPSGSVYVPAEYADLEGVLLHVPRYEGWTEPALWTAYYRDLIRGIADAGTMVYILVPDQSRANQLRATVIPASVPPSQITFLEIENRTTWTRDFGPWHVYEDGQRVIVDPYYYGSRQDDDLVPVRLGELWNEPRYTAALYTEGGNFMTDGLGSCWASTGVLQRNGLSQAVIEQIYADYVGCNTITFVAPIPGEGTTHIDMFAKVLNQDTIMVGESSSSLGASAAEVAHLNQVAEVLRSSPKPDGGEWTIVRVPMTFGNFNFGTPWNPQVVRVYSTHTNSLVVNNTVLVPTYGRGTDAQALQIYRDAMPGYEVVGIESTKPIRIGGALHCTTMQIPTSVYRSCGDGVIAGEEECEPRYLGGASCESLGYAQGELGCSADCTFDTSACTGQTVCGDGQLDPGEVCDGDQTACAELEPELYESGMAVCQSDCASYDTSACIESDPEDDPDNENDCVDAACVNDQPQAIPDSSSTGIRSEIAVGGFAGTLGQVRVQVDITHTYRGDLVVDLVSPGGTSIRLHNRAGGSADNLSLDLTLGGFAAEDPNGTWTLAVFDTARQDVGSLRSWSLQFAGESEPPVRVVVTRADRVARGEWKHYGPYQTADGLSARLTMDSGDADVYVLRDRQPSTGSYDCRPYKGGNQTETCELSGAGDYYVSVNGWDPSTDFELTIEYDEP